MPNNSPPEQQLAQFLSPEQLTEALKPTSVDPNLVTSTLGGIGLGDVQAQGLPPDSNDKKTRHTHPEHQQVAESIREQLDVSYRAYLLFTYDSNTMPYDDFSITSRRLEEKLVEWAASGSLELVRERQEADPELTFDLVISPNAVMGHKLIYGAADVFAKGQVGWDEAYINKDFCNKYSAEELSGYPAAAADGRKSEMSFMLIPSKYNIEPAGIEYQLQIFEQLKQDYCPTLIIPSVKDGIAWWYTKRQQQRAATGDPNKQLDVTHYSETYLRHINLTPKQRGSWVSVPGSCVDDDGQPRLVGSVVEVGSGVRVAIG